jgi:hypothetical protein
MKRLTPSPKQRVALIKNCEHGAQIYRVNRELMDSCDGIIANHTPFRGVSGDPTLRCMPIIARRVFYEAIINPILAPNNRDKVIYCQALLLHPKFNGLHRVRKVHWVVSPFIRFYKRDENIQPVTFRSVRFRSHSR